MSKLIALLFAMMLFSVAIASESNNVEPNETIECYGCQLFVTAIDNYLESNKSISGLEQYATEACQFLGSYKSICEEEVPQVVPLIVEYLEKELSPEQICQELGVCTNNSTDEYENMSFYCFELHENELEDKEEDDEEEVEISPCNICEGLLRITDEYLDRNTTQAKLENLFNTECTKFFPQHEQSCSQFSNFLIPRVSEILESTNICKDMGVCQ